MDWAELFIQWYLLRVDAYVERPWLERCKREGAIKGASVR